MDTSKVLTKEELGNFGDLELNKAAKSVRITANKLRNMKNGTEPKEGGDVTEWSDDEFHAKALEAMWKFYCLGRIHGKRPE